MRYIDASFTEIREEKKTTYVALAAHNCYQVLKNDNENDFILRLEGFKHYAVFEHGRFVASVSKELYFELVKINDKFIDLFECGGEYLVSFSYRPLLEKNSFGKLIDILPSYSHYMFPNHEFNKPQGRILSEEEISALPNSIYKKVKYVTIKIDTDRGVTHELVRHRAASYAQESTRYCNYAKDKFGNEITIIKPLDYEQFKETYDASFKASEEAYFKLLELGSKPEMARAVLPTKLKATIYLTCSIEEYEHIFELRTSPRAHPDIAVIFNAVKEQFEKEGYLR
jgi:thymidylate synthase ThyX